MSDPVDRAAVREAEITRIAKFALNGWACYAKRKIETDDIHKLWGELDAALALPAEPAQATAEKET